MINEMGERIKQLSSGARWGIAAAAALLLLGIAAVCSMTGLLMMTFATDACRQLPDWAALYIVLPPAMMALGALLPPLLFALRQRWLLILGSLGLSWVLSIILYIGWLPIIATQC